jgi:hypothetical protein
MNNEPTDPIDVLGYEQGLEVCEQQKGWLVITGKEGDTFNPRAFFFSQEAAEQYCALEVDDGLGGKESVAFDACAVEAVIYGDRIIAANDFTIEGHQQLLEHVMASMPPVPAEHSALSSLESAMAHIKASGHAGSAIMSVPQILAWAREIGWQG